MAAATPDAAPPLPRRQKRPTLRADHQGGIAMKSAAAAIAALALGLPTAVGADATNGEAQAWYDEGLLLYHAFNHRQAPPGSSQAAALDPTCALCEWGV